MKVEDLKKQKGYESWLVNIPTKFRLNEKVVIRRGLYRGFKGVIKDIEFIQQKQTESQQLLQEPLKPLTAYKVEIQLRDGNVYTNLFEENNLKKAFF